MLVFCVCVIAYYFLSLKINTQSSVIWENYLWVIATPTLFSMLLCLSCQLKHTSSNYVQLNVFFPMLLRFFHFTTITANFLLLINLHFSNNFACILCIKRDNTKFCCSCRRVISVITLCIIIEAATKPFPYQSFNCSVCSKHNLGRGLSKRRIFVVCPDQGAVARSKFALCLIKGLIIGSTQQKERNRKNTVWTLAFMWITSYKKKVHKLQCCNTNSFFTWDKHIRWEKYTAFSKGMHSITTTLSYLAFRLFEARTAFWYVLWYHLSRS